MNEFGGYNLPDQHVLKEITAHSIDRGPGTKPKFSSFLSHCDNYCAHSAASIHLLQNKNNVFKFKKPVTAHLKGNEMSKCWHSLRGKQKMSDYSGIWNFSEIT